jgi:hypothetical protein
MAFQKAHFVLFVRRVLSRSERAEMSSGTATRRGRLRFWTGRSDEREAREKLRVWAEEMKELRRFGDATARLNLRSSNKCLLASVT